MFLGRFPSSALVPWSGCCRDCEISEMGSDNAVKKMRLTDCLSSSFINLAISAASAVSGDDLPAGCLSKTILWSSAWKWRSVTPQPFPCSSSSTLFLFFIDLTGLYSLFLFPNRVVR